MPLEEQGVPFLKFSLTRYQGFLFSAVSAEAADFWLEMLLEMRM